MTVSELCNRLREITEVQLAAVLQGSTEIPDTDFPEALGLEWLADNIQAVFETVNREGCRQDEMIGILESNAFLASFQKAYQNSRRNRIQRWARTYSRINQIASENGPLQKQLRHVGIKVEEEFLTEVLNLGRVE